MTNTQTLTVTDDELLPDATPAQRENMARRATMAYFYAAGRVDADESLSHLHGALDVAFREHYRLMSAEYLSERRTSLPSVPAAFDEYVDELRDKLTDVNTWADGFGIWHVAITAPAGYRHAGMADIARERMVDELRDREGPHFAPESVRVNYTAHETMDDGRSRFVFTEIPPAADLRLTVDDIARDELRAETMDVADVVRALRAVADDIEASA